MVEVLFPEGGAGPPRRPHRLGQDQNQQPLPQAQRIPTG
jgi:hypothetical protein